MKHCLKGGQGDYDVCWHVTDFCTCKCLECQLSTETMEKTQLRHGPRKWIRISFNSSKQKSSKGKCKMGPEEKDESDLIAGVDEDPETGYLVEEENEPGLNNDFDWAGGD